MSPFKKERYPPDWPSISLRIRGRSGGQCECEGECGLHHERRCQERNGESAVWAKGKVVLTVAHLNHVEMDCRDANLKAMCQRCHLRYDSARHQENARKTREGKRNGGNEESVHL